MRAALLRALAKWVERHTGNDRIAIPAGNVAADEVVRVHVFRNRLPMMHRHGWDGPRASSSTAYAWFVFDKKHGGPATIDQISARTEGAMR